MRTFLVPSLLLSVLLAVPGQARAAEPEPAPFEPSIVLELAGFEDQAVDTGWIPQGSPVQMRLFVSAGNSVAIDMPGRALYDWDAEAVRFAGTAGAGRFAYDVGVRIEAKVRFDVQGQVWESDLLGPYDWAIQDAAVFTPYLLPGHPERPVQIEDDTDDVDVASIPVAPNLLIASGTLDIALRAQVEGRLEGIHVEVVPQTAPGPSTFVTETGAFADLPAGPGPGPVEAEGRTLCRVRHAPTVVVYPHLVLTVLGQAFDIAGIEVPVPLPPLDDTVALSPEPIAFEARPAPAPGGDTTGAATGDPTDTGTDTGTSTGADPAGTGTDSAGAAAASEGCGCRAPRGPGRPGAIVGALGLAALLPARRRRAGRRGRRRPPPDRRAHGRRAGPGAGASAPGQTERG